LLRAGGPKLTAAEQDFAIYPESLTDAHIGRMTLDLRYLIVDDVKGFTRVVQRRAGRPPRHGVLPVVSTAAIIVSRKLRGQGYGLLLFLRSVALAERQRHWLVSDYKYRDSAAALRVWTRLAGLTQYSFAGRVKTFDPTRQPQKSLQPFRAVYGLNSRGRAVLTQLEHALLVS
jgi:hypothetical protein